MEKEGKKGKQKKEGGRVDEGDVSTLQAFKQQQNPEGKFIMYTMAPIALQYKQAFQFQPVKQTSKAIFDIWLCCHRAIVFSSSWTYSLTQLLEQLLKFEEEYTVHCVYTLSLRLLKKCFNPNNFIKIDNFNFIDEKLLK